MKSTMIYLDGRLHAIETDKQLPVTLKLLAYRFPAAVITTKPYEGKIQKEE